MRNMRRERRESIQGIIAATIFIGIIVAMFVAHRAEVAEPAPEPVPAGHASSEYTIDAGSKLMLTATALTNDVTFPLPTLVISESSRALPAAAAITGNQLIFMPADPGVEVAVVELRDVETGELTEATVTVRVLPATTPSTPAAVTERVTAGRLIVDAVGLDVALGSVEPDANNAINPPDDDRAFLVVAPGFGALHDNNRTTFIAIHSGRGTNLSAAGNALVDRKSARSTLDPGDLITVDGETFIVRKTATAEKTALPADVFNSTYDLIVVTCQQYADGAPSKNSIIYADRTTT